MEGSGRAYTVTVMQASVQGDLYHFQPCFLVDCGDERVGRLFVQLTGTGAAIADARMDATEEILNESMMRLGVSRLEQVLSASGGAVRFFGENATHDYKLGADDLDELLTSDTTDKECGYRHTEGRDLYCTAADKTDESVVGSIGHRMAAPTSRPICNNCALPDGRTLCSNLSHPRVSAVATFGAYERYLGQAWCNAGRAEVEDPSGCRAGGHACWVRIIEEEAPTAPPATSPLTLPEALDFLDAMWRLAFGKNRHLVRPSTFADPAGLTSTAESADQFEVVIGDLADALDRITVPDELLPEGESPPSGSLNRLAAVLRSREVIDSDTVDSAVATLQSVRGLRHTHAHSGAAVDRPRILRDLGLSDFGSDRQALWDGLRARTVEALLTPRSQVRRLTEDSDGVSAIQQS